MKVATTLLMIVLLVCSSLSSVASAKDAERIFVGQKAPDFTLPAHSGGEISLSNYLGQKSVVLVFYPLAFTPV
jgi:peroxiredoxin